MTIVCIVVRYDAHREYVHNKIIYFLTLCKTYPGSKNLDNLASRRYRIKETLSYNGISIYMDLQVNITKYHVYNLKTIRINGKA